MASNHFHIAVVLLMASLLGVMSAGCEDEPQPQAPPQPWEFDSSKAPYAVRVPGEWQQTSNENVANRFADLAVTLDDSFYLIVIPQKLPQYEGVEAPNAKSVKNASIGLFQKSVDQFEVEREGAVELDGEPAISVFAEGLHDNDEQVQYITTFVTRGPWGYQIIAWGPQQQEDSLVAATDALLQGWQFRGTAPADPPSSQPSEGADAGKD